MDTTSKDANIFWQKSHVDRQTRAEMLNQQGATLWITGLSCAGKSSLAFSLEFALTERKYKSYVLDGDNLRHGLNVDLGFSKADREENIRRTGEIAKLFADAGLIVIASLISPYIKDRRLVRKLHDDAGLKFVEVFIDTPLEICEQRDNKRLYAKARRGEIGDFTGISSPYERPENPDITITPDLGPKEGGDLILDYLQDRGIVRTI